MDVTLGEAFTFLVSAKQRDFWATVVSCLVRKVRPGYGTMGVGVSREGELVLYYDPDFVAKLNMHELILTCAHEVYHIALGHISRYVDLISGIRNKEELRRYRAAMNIAADCAVNELMRSEPNFDKNQNKGPWFYGCEENEGRSFLIPETFKMPRNQPFEVYLYVLLREMDKVSHQIGKMTVEQYVVPVQIPPQKGEGGDQGSQDQGQSQQEQSAKGEEGEQPKDGVAILDTYFNGKTGNAHQFWEEHLKDKTSEEMQGLADHLRNEAKNVLRQAVKSHLKSRGTIPAGIKDYIDALLAKPKIPWPTIFRTLVMRTRQTKIARGMNRPNRRLHGVPNVLPYPGRARDSKFTILFALDTSGSMSNDELALALRELLNIVKTEQDVHLVVMYCDAALHLTYDVEEESDVDFNVLGRGGTDFNPPFIALRKLLRTDRAPDVVVYATDGFAPEPAPENRVPIPVIWLLTPEGQVPSKNYGIHLRMEPQ